MSTRGVLQHGGEYHHRAPCGLGQQQIAAPDAELGPARGHLVDDVGAGAGLAWGVTRKPASR